MNIINKKILKFAEKHGIDVKTFFAMYGIMVLCFSKDKSIGFIIQMLQDTAGVNHECAVTFLYEFTDSE